MSTKPTWKRRGFKSYNEYIEHLAKEKGFESYTKYREYLVKKRGFESYHQYQEHLAKKKGFESLNKYQEYMAKEQLARRKGFESYAKYEEHIAKEEMRMVKEKLCGSIQKIASNMQDPESIFHDIEFLEKITTLNSKLSYKIPTKKREDK